MSSYLVTGGDHLLGARLAEQLVRYNQGVTLVNNNCKDKHKFTGRVPHQIYIKDERSMRAALQHARYVFHSLVLPSRCGASNQKSYRVNVEGTLRLLSAMKNGTVKRLVILSSTSVYGEPQSDVIHEGLLPHPKSSCAADVLAAENYCKAFGSEHGIEVVILRCSTIYEAGKGKQPITDDLIASLIHAAQNKTRPVLFGTPTCKLDYLYVGDAVRASLKAMHTTGIAGEVFNIASGTPMSLNDVVNKLNDALHCQSKPIYRWRDDSIFNNITISIEKARDILNYEPKFTLASILDHSFFRREKVFA